MPPSRHSSSHYSSSHHSSHSSSHHSSSRSHSSHSSGHHGSSVSLPEAVIVASHRCVASVLRSHMDGTVRCMGQYVISFVRRMIMIIIRSAGQRQTVVHLRKVTMTRTVSIITIWSWSAELRC